MGLGGEKIHGIRPEVSGGGTHLELESSHFCCAVVTDNEAMGTERVVPKDVLSACLLCTLGVWTRLFGEEAVGIHVRCEELSLAGKLATSFSVKTFNNELVYHLKGN
jgi:hypothetical protein